MLKLYRRGQVSLDQFLASMQQPVHTGGPLNLRPFCDPDWYQQGGAGEVLVCISYFYHTLPTVVVPKALRDSSLEGPALYNALLSPRKFFERCTLIKKQAVRYLKHPLLLELTQTLPPARIAKIKAVAQQWRGDTKDMSTGAGYEAPPNSVFGFACSSIGNVRSNTNYRDHREADEHVAGELGTS